jgi:hypothetical protein
VSVTRHQLAQRHQRLPAAVRTVSSEQRVELALALGRQLHHRRLPGTCAGRAGSGGLAGQAGAQRAHDGLLRHAEQRRPCAGPPAAAASAHRRCHGVVDVDHAVGALEHLRARRAPRRCGPVASGP